VFNRQEPSGVRLRATRHWASHRELTAQAGRSTEPNEAVQSEELRLSAQLNHTSNGQPAMQFRLGVLGEITNRRDAPNAPGADDPTQLGCPKEAEASRIKRAIRSILNDENFNRGRPKMKSPMGRMSGK